MISTGWWILLVYTIGLFATTYILSVVYSAEGSAFDGQSILPILFWPITLVLLVFITIVEIGQKHGKEWGEK